MKYFIDTEFIEGFHKQLFGKRRHFIDLISIGIVAEDGREYYAISRDFNPKDADQWVKDNVISKLPAKWVNPSDVMASPRSKHDQYLWRHNNQIRDEIKTFVNMRKCNEGYGPFWTLPEDKTPLEFYAYYADYDWVVFCSLFGRMIDLPKGFPMYCRDLKQMMDDKAESLIMQVEMKYQGETRFDTSLRKLKSHPDYPKQKDEHNALADAKLNKELYKFLTNPIAHVENLTSIAAQTPSTNSQD